MSLWGNKDLVANTSTIAVNFSTLTVTGAATTFSTAGVAEGDVLVVGAGATFGYAVVKSVTSNTSLSIHSTDYFVSGITTIAAGASYFITQLPIYTLGDVNYDAPNAKSNRTSSVFGVDTTEQAVVNAASGDARKYAAPHAGWVGVTTYVDTHGNLRVKTETLVAGSSITTDAADDAKYPDS